MTTYKIGRGSDNDIVIDDTSISRVHAELVTLPDGRYSLRDLGSSNGTMIQADNGWEMVDKTTIEPNQPLRLGKRQLTPNELIALVGAVPAPEAAQGIAARDTAERYDAGTDTGGRARDAVERPAVVSASSLPRWVVPAAAGGGGLVLIAIVVVVLLLGPLGGPGESEFVGVCSLNIGSKSKCKCWADGLRKGMSGQEFTEMTVAIRKRDWRTALPPALREKFTALRPAIEARCGSFGS